MFGWMCNTKHCTAVRFTSAELSVEAKISVRKDLIRDEGLRLEFSEHDAADERYGRGGEEASRARPRPAVRARAGVPSLRRLQCRHLASASARLLPRRGVLKP